MFALAALLVLAFGYWFGRPPAAALANPNATPQVTPVRDSWQGIAKRQAAIPARAQATARPPSSLPLGPFGANVDELKRRTEAGDARAAKALADGFRRCEFFTPPKDEGDLKKRAEDSTVQQLNLVDQIVDQVKEAAAKNRVQIGKIPEVNSLDAYHAQLNAETELAQACDGVIHADASDWRGWYAHAAELGDADAQLGYWHVAFAYASIASLDAIPQQKIVAAAALQRSLANGDWRALAAIGEVLKIGYFAEPDSFSAHAYFFAASQGPTSNIGVLPWIGNGFGRLFSGNDTHTYLEGQLRMTASPLDPQQVAASERIGAELYSRCCSGVGR